MFSGIVYGPKIANKIYIDGLSFAKIILNYDENSWDLDVIKLRIKRFCEFIRI